MPIVDSERLASYRLGYFLTFLKGVQERVYEGNNDGEEDFTACVSSLKDAAFILAKRATFAENEQFEEILRSAQNHYGDAMTAGRRLERLFSPIQQGLWNKLDILSKRLINNTIILNFWYEFGHCLAESIQHVLYKRGVSLPEGHWEEIVKRSAELPPADRELLVQAIPEEAGDRSGLLWELKETNESMKIRLPLLDAGEGQELQAQDAATTVSAGPAPPPKNMRIKRRVDDSIERRDEFIYDKYVEGFPLARIRHELKQVQYWSHLDTDAAVTRAAQRLAERRGLPRPKHGQKVNPRLSRQSDQG